MTHRPLRVGIISAAWGAKAHLPAWRSLDGVEVTAICTSRPETAAQAAADFQIGRAFHDFRAMAADPDIDIIDCGTRPALRYEMVMAALSNGKHVYNGIPFAKDLADATAMHTALQQAGTVGAVDAFMQAVPAIAQMKAMIQEGWIGDIYGADIRFEAALFTMAQTNVPGYVWFRDPANGASATRNLGSHMLHALVHILGPMQRVCADEHLSLKQWPMPDGPVSTQVPDQATLLLRSAQNIPARLVANWSMIGGEGFRLSVWGSKGRLEARAPVFPMAHDTVLLGTQNPALGTSRPEEIPIRSDFLQVSGSSSQANCPETGLLPMAKIFASMRDAILHGTKTAPDFHQALHVQQILEAAIQSGTNRHWIDIPH